MKASFAVVRSMKKSTAVTGKKLSADEKHVLTCPERDD
jgi:hypothetical protein